MNENEYYNILLDKNSTEKKSNFPGGMITTLYVEGKAVACREIYGNEVEYYVP